MGGEADVGQEVGGVLRHLLARDVRPGQLVVDEILGTEQNRRGWVSLTTLGYGMKHILGMLGLSAKTQQGNQ